MNNTAARDALVEQIKQADNILVALNSNPTIDELTSALALTLILAKTNDHVTTIFSGKIPSVLNFLEPNKFFDKTVDGLRDFIIALNPDKADRVRTKIVDDMVRVSITPSKGAVTIDDLEFSQGDYNVDLVIALGVRNPDDLDKALQAHGRILHSAFVAAISIGTSMTDLGNLNWQEPALQSYAQIVADLTLSLEPKPDENGNPVDVPLIDNEVATVLMTGLVAVTERFSNSYTTPELMSLAAVLMSQGANQQLVAKELEQPIVKPAKPVQEVADSQEPAKPKNKIEQEAVIPHVDKKVEQATDDASLSSQLDEIVNQLAKKTSDKPTTAKKTLADIEAEVKDKASAASGEPTKSTSDVVIKVTTTTSEAATSTKNADASKAETKPTGSGQTISKTEDAWDKVNQFKEAFAKKMQQRQQEISQTTNKQSENLTDSPKLTTKPEQKSNSGTEKRNETSTATRNVPAANPVNSQAQKSADRAGQSDNKVVDASKVGTNASTSKLKAQHKPQKVIAPLEHTVAPGPSVSERIAQELKPALAIPPMPAGMPLPPPLPPMPPEFDQMTMTSLPPMGQPSFANNPFDQLDKPAQTSQNNLPPVNQIPTSQTPPAQQVTSTQPMVNAQPQPPVMPPIASAPATQPAPSSSPAPIQPPIPPTPNTSTATHNAIETPANPTPEAKQPADASQFVIPE